MDSKCVSDNTKLEDAIKNYDAIKENFEDLLEIISEIDVLKTLKSINAIGVYNDIHNNSKVCEIFFEGKRIAEEFLEITKDATVEKFKQIFHKYREIAIEYIYILYYIGKSSEIVSVSLDYYTKAYEFGSIENPNLVFLRHYNLISSL